MPTVSKGDMILVSGASGFIGSHTARHFLKAGYKVRGTVRSKSKGEYLANLFKDDGHFEYAIVEDISKDGSFDEAVKGVDGVAHTASPFYTEGITDPQQLIDPALKGTTGILKSIQKNNPDVKRVVVTSSVSAIMSTISKPKPHRYTEEEWNEDSVPLVEKEGAKAPGGHIYNASKTLAERALWDFIKTENPSWDAATINPPVVLGDVIHECPSVDKLNTSVKMFYVWASGQKKEEDLPAQGANWVNVHDVAEGHVLAMTSPKASGERFMISSGPMAGQDYCDVLHKHFPDLPNIPVGKPGTHDEICKGANVFDGSKAERVLGMKYTSFEDTVIEMCKSLRSRYNF